MPFPCKSCKTGAPGEQPGTTALMRAAGAGHDMCVGSLVNSGADVNRSQWELSNTALAWAVNGGHEKCVEVLIKAKANVEADYHCKPVSTLAARKGYVKCLDLLIKAGADVNRVFRFFPAFTTAARFGKHDCMALLIKAGSEAVDVTTQFGKHALSFVASKGKAKCLELVLGADVNKIESTNVKDSEGRRNAISEALITAAECGRLSCIKTLIRAGADVNFRMNHLDSALITAVSSQQFDCASLLIDEGADVNMTGSHKETPLSAAAKSNGFQCLQLVLKKGAHVNKTNSNGYNALQSHINRKLLARNKSIGRLLLAAGEMLDGNRKGCDVTHVPVPAFLLALTQPEPSLKEMCRKIIRGTLIRADRHTNLFMRVPQLELFPNLQAYLLFDISLDDPADTVDNLDREAVEDVEEDRDYGYDAFCGEYEDGEGEEEYRHIWS